MGRRADNGQLSDACLSNVQVGEPFFVLRAKDVCAPLTVRRWADEAQRRGTPQPKIDDALAIASEMEEWARLHGGPKVPD